MSDTPAPITTTCIVKTSTYTLDGLQVIANLISDWNPEARLMASSVLQARGDVFATANIMPRTRADAWVEWSVRVSQAALKRGINALNIVQALASVTGDTGCNGQADFAVGGGRDPDKAQAALDALPALLTPMLTKSVGEKAASGDVVGE